MTNKSGYKLKTLDIRYQDWGEYKGKYTGKIAFENGDNEAFTFNLTQAETQAYLDLLASKLMGSAATLADKLLDSMNLLPMVEKNTAIEEAIPGT
jgi:hypothetical protein